MIDHISVGGSDLARSAAFYEAAFAPFGLTKVIEHPANIGFGKAYPEFWLNLRAGMTRVAPDTGTPICLRAKTTGEVDAFYHAALKAGGADDGAPGQRPHWGVKYYAAFVTDPDGHRIEVVTFLKEDIKPA